ncbi:hypothetical protein H6G33_10420 [Calothrix sp. FACHB-1219]|uniref:hypothetical protein n=1 Tax=unclassified Calothrix TaxID=2619626 RepID=UPI0016852E57|nr:hypothetical protein [Calothrix sp. FACHB-1219]MBD2201761.1 hypothetical protein [Calothrix sp. FACHB-168]MBD2217447.1 hypothetical protein [Calothrix sp. FACHB-1219]
MDLSLSYSLGLSVKYSRSPSSNSTLEDEVSFIEKTLFLTIPNSKLHKSTFNLIPSATTNIDLLSIGINYVRNLFIKSTELIRCQMPANTIGTNSLDITSKIIFLDNGSVNTIVSKTPPFNLTIQNKGSIDTNIQLVILGL